MGRTREFCVDEALAKALDVFWRNGFEGSSLAELTDAMGIARPSLYATYGNKEQLYRQALDLYEERYMGFVRDALNEASAHEVVAKILYGFVDVGTGSGSPPGCMGTNGALACSTSAASIKEELYRRRAALESALAERLERARLAGDLPKSSSPADLAGFVMTMAGGIAVQAAGGTSGASLRRVVALALNALP
jgi:AcrR family transcriptional regulator